MSTRRNIMKFTKRIVSFAASTALCIAILPASVFAHQQDNINKGTFSYYNNGTSSMTTADYYYSDSYFTHPSTQLDEHLSTMSFVLTAAQTGRDSAAGILTENGFGDVSREDMDVHTSQTIGTVIANKTTENGDKLIAVFVCGINYGAEWESNLTVGSKGDAEGFSAAAKKVYDRIVKYEQQHGLKGAKLWITGYSRAGAVADMTGKLVNENLDVFGITENDLFDYAFAVPRASEKALGYKNIHDIVDDNDLVPRLMPKGWGIDRAGTEFVLPAPEQTIDMKKVNLFGGDIISNTGEKMATSKFLDQFMDFLSGKISRESYDSARDSLPQFVTKLLLEGTNSGKYTVINFLADTFKGFGLSSPLFQPALTLLMYPESSADYQKVMNDLDKTIADFLDSSEYKDKISQEDLQQAKQAIPAALKVFLPAIRSDFPGMFTNFATLAGNASKIISNHYASSYFDKLTAIDSFYAKA